MTALENMKTRLNYAGGTAQIARMNADKLNAFFIDNEEKVEN